ncbi:SDR family oxidoreductase [Actinoplanes sp. TBRC 11911]|nr:SDR family oxidoreductase [Actinoplanes sp. TBRC 11911]
MSGLAGKVALVTGASTAGIGRSTALKLAREGARVAVHYRNGKQGAEETLAAVEAEGGSGFLVCADFSEPGGAKKLWADFDLHSQTVDIVVNNAGLRGPGFDGLAGAEEKLYDQLFAINLRAPLLIIQEALRRMPNGGRIINVSTAATYVAIPSDLLYSTLKAGTNLATRTLAWELGGRKITVNSVAPGFINAPMAAPFLAVPEIAAWMKTINALQDVGEPIDVANVIVFLASDEGRWITGQVLDASGGTVLGVPPIQR